MTDRAMNLSQHAGRTGYSREQLAKFKPLLIGGKIRPSELDRHIYEYRKWIMQSLSPVASGLAANFHQRVTEDKLRELCEKYVQQDASRVLSESLFHSSGSRKSRELSGK